MNINHCRLIDSNKEALAAPVACKALIYTNKMPKTGPDNNKVCKNGTPYVSPRQPHID
ncbi:MAG: hypothetical protein PHY65_10300 [Bacteroidales bacterium]|nr:hypothetical protein [Bacteroidales bacterium]